MKLFCVVGFRSQDPVLESANFPALGQDDAAWMFVRDAASVTMEVEILAELLCGHVHPESMLFLMIHKAEHKEPVKRLVRVLRERGRETHILDPRNHFSEETLAELMSHSAAALLVAS